MKLVRRGTLTGALVGSVISLLACAAALAHIERPSYWPLPAADCSIHPCACGAVPHARTLRAVLHPRVGSATNGSATRVVCRPNSPALLRRSDADAPAPPLKPPAS